MDDTAVPLDTAEPLYGMIQQLTAAAAMAAQAAAAAAAEAAVSAAAVPTAA